MNREEVVAIFNHHGMTIYAIKDYCLKHGRDKAITIALLQYLHIEGLIQIALNIICNKHEIITLQNSKGVFIKFL